MSGATPVNAVREKEFQENQLSIDTAPAIIG